MWTSKPLTIIIIIILHSRLQMRPLLGNIMTKKIDSNVVQGILDHHKSAAARRRALQSLAAEIDRPS